LDFKHQKEGNKQAALIWDATTFVTSQINAIGAEGFKSMEVICVQLRMSNPSYVHDIFRLNATK